MKTKSKQPIQLKTENEISTTDILYSLGIDVF